MAAAGSERVSPEAGTRSPMDEKAAAATHRHEHGDGVDHDHDGSELSEMDLRVRALESLLIDKGYVDPQALDVLIEAYETRVGPHNGAHVVAKAWTDPAFRRRLL